MTDRTPMHPGRVKLTPVSGQDNTYDMTRADEPMHVGTPLNKATLLTDETAQAIGLTSDDPTVDEALFALLSNVSVAIEVANSKVKIETGSYTGAGKYGTGSKNKLTFGFAPKLVIIQKVLPATSGAGISLGILVGGDAPCGYAYGYSSNIYAIGVNISGNTVSWYSTIDSDNQLNSNLKYSYVALG